MAEETNSTDGVEAAGGPAQAESVHDDGVTGTVAHAGVPSHAEAPGVIDVSGPMMLMTWITFGILAFVLYKIAWKPILLGLDERESSIRKSLGDAAKARAELAEVEARTKQMMAEARAEGEAIVSAARKSAVDLANAVEKRAQEKTLAMTEEAKREIAAATDKARLTLRAETADMAISLAGRIIGENMDSEKNRALTRKIVSGN